MSYDIDLLDPVSGDVLQLDEAHQMKGGTYAIGGTTEASLNITWNYSKYYYRLIDAEHGIRAIYGMSGGDSIPMLENAISGLGDDVNLDYWEPTEGNAKRALIQLLTLAKLRPDGVWAGD